MSFSVLKRLVEIEVVQLDHTTHPAIMTDDIQTLPARGDPCSPRVSQAAISGVSDDDGTSPQRERSLTVGGAVRRRTTAKVASLLTYFELQGNTKDRCLVRRLT